MQALVDSGTLASVETHRVARRAGLARIELQEAEAELAAARFSLAAVWGSRSPLFTEAVGDLERLKPLPDLETVLELASDNPLASRWDLELARTNAALALAKSGRVPDVDLGAGVRWDAGTGEPDYLIDLEIDLPIFDLKRGDVREAQHDLARAQAGQRAAASAGSENVAVLYYEVVAAGSRSRTMADEVTPAALAAFEAFRIAFEATAENLEDLLDARRDLTRAEVDRAEALVDYHVAFATLEQAVGETITP